MANPNRVRQGRQKLKFLNHHLNEHLSAHVLVGFDERGILCFSCQCGSDMARRALVSALGEALDRFDPFDGPGNMDSFV